MSLKIIFSVAFLAVVAAQNKNGAGQTRYGGRPNHQGGGFQTGFPQGGAIQGGFPGGVAHQGGFAGQGFGGQGAFPGAGGIVQPGVINPGFPGGGQPGFIPGVGHGQPGLVGGGHAGLGGAGSPTATGAALAYDCAATASQGQFGIDATCQKFCKAPQQYWGGKYVCCDDRPAFCPPVRKECPRFGGKGPVCCFVDSQCQIPTDKCCYDTCLGHKVCKPAGKQGF
ncbi:hypothetical protein FHG87_005227 [Trinorchestia longiramus]|nr:hypothetical protein FHG87_005227 [Trinorchestia longiramus]